jgi:hypothetical protein
LRVAVANAAGDTIYKYPAPGEVDQPFGLLNGSEVRLVTFVTRVP